MIELESRKYSFTKLSILEIMFVKQGITLYFRIEESY